MRKKLIKSVILFLAILTIPVMQGCSDKKDKSDNQLVVKEVTKDDMLWSFETGGAILSSPVKFENNLIFGSSDNKLYSLDVDTHQEKWSFQSDGIINNTPIINENTVIFSTQTTCYLLDATTGKEIWNYKSNSVGKDGINKYDYHSPSPIIYNDLVVFPTVSGTMYGLNIANGNMQWEYKAEGSSDIRTTPAIQGDTLCFGDLKGQCYAMDLKTQKTLWQKSIGTDVVHSVSVSNDKAYFAGRDVQVVAFDLKDGTRVWHDVDNMASWLTGESLVHDDVLYVGGSDNHKTTAYNCETGEIIRNYYGNANIFAKPTVSGDKFFYTDGDAYQYDEGNVYAFDLKDNGKKVWRLKMDKPIFTAPIVIDDVVYFGSTDGSFYAIKVEV